MNQHYEQAYKKISKYKLTKIQKALVYKQLSDVLEEVDDQLIDELYLDEIINDIFEINEIPKVKGKLNYRFDSIFFGLLFIISAILLIIQPFNQETTILLYAIASTFYFVVKRLYFLACIAIYFVISSTIIAGSATLALAIFLIYIGLKILFFKGNKNMQYLNINEHSPTRHQSHNKNYADTDVLFVDNSFNGSNIKLVKEQISYINLNNKFGGSELDFTDYEFIKGDLVLNVNNKYGGLSLSINENTNVVFLVSNRFGGVSTKDKHKFKEAKHTIFVQGDNKFGGIDAIYI